jgi:hypothetical protein
LPSSRLITVSFTLFSQSDDLWWWTNMERLLQSNTSSYPHLSTGNKISTSEGSSCPRESMSLAYYGTTSFTFLERILSDAYHSVSRHSGGP